MAKSFKNKEEIERESKIDTKRNKKKKSEWKNSQMSSPNIGSSDLSSSPISPSGGGDSSTAAKDYRKRQNANAPSYSPNETLNQMTQEVDNFFYL